MLPELPVRRPASSESERCCSSDAQRNSATPATSQIDWEKLRSPAPEGDKEMGTTL